LNIPIVYEDQWLLVADKPSGLLVIPAPKKGNRTLTSILNEDLLKQGKLYRLHPCHRLDRQTSGLIIYAKGKSVQKKMMEEFKARGVKKTYVVFTRGRLERMSGEIDCPIEGKAAQTAYKVIERRKDFDIVEAYPVSGRTNQIRLHFQGLGHPVLGEDKYAFRRDFPLKAKRLCLHAQTLEFRHPVTGGKISLRCELPPELKKFLEVNRDV